MNAPPMILPVNRTLAIIMGGGAGTRLFPLTNERAKPAVPLAGKYRLVDIPISNCLNSGIRGIYVLTQFNSMSLHRHINASYKFDNFTPSFVEILAAQQTPEGSRWYQGTADAVRQNMRYFLERPVDYYIILSGDQLYRMDLQQIVAEHVDTKAELTVATIPVDRDNATSLGILRINEQRKIIQFEEKPKDPAVLDTLKLDAATRSRLGIPGDTDRYLASMGIYVFNRDVLIRLLDNTHTDFGKHIIPGAIHTNEVYAHIFQGYWEDIGTIRSFFEANLDVTAELPRFNFFDMSAPIYTRPRFLPASKINGAAIDHAIISDGCIINRCQISHSLVGVRSLIGEGSRLNRVICMGNDYYESQESIEEFGSAGIPKIGIGLNSRIENAIIDKNARIGDNVVISPEGKPDNADHPLYFMRDGIVIIPKAGVVPHNTVI